MLLAKLLVLFRLDTAERHNLFLHENTNLIIDTIYAHISLHTPAVSVSRPSSAFHKAVMASESLSRSHTFTCAAPETDGALNNALSLTGTPAQPANLRYSLTRSPAQPANVRYSLAGTPAQPAKPSL